MAIIPPRANPFTSGCLLPRQIRKDLINIQKIPPKRKIPPTMPSSDKYSR